MAPKNNSLKSSSAPSTQTCDQASLVCHSVQQSAEAPPASTTKKRTRRGGRKKKHQPETESLISEPAVTSHESKQPAAKENKPIHNSVIAAAAFQPPSAPIVPPIVIRSCESWVPLVNGLKSANVEIKYAKVTGHGIKLCVEDIKSFRKTIKHFIKHKIQFHSFQLDENKTVKAVVRGLPLSIQPDDVKKAIASRKFPVLSAHRIKIGPTRHEVPLVYVQLSNTKVGRQVFNIKTLFNHPVTVEPLMRKKTPTQCHRCQLYGHSASMCHAAPKCVKCSGDHLSNTCTVPKEIPATCANCKGDHPANYKGCKAFPKQKPPPRSPSPVQSEDSDLAFLSDFDGMNIIDMLSEMCSEISP